MKFLNHQHFLINSFNKKVTTLKDLVPIKEYKCRLNLKKITLLGLVRGQEINKVPKFCTAIFSSVEAKNADIPIGMVSIFNEK